MTGKNLAPLTHEELVATLHYNAQTGSITRRNKSARNMYRDGDAGTIGTNGRRYIAIEGKQYIAHRLVWFYVHGQWPKNNLAPKDGDYLNLKIENWFEESQADTTRRGKRDTANTSGARGVHWDKSRGKWLANISVGYKTIYVGRFTSKEEAIQAYEAARIKHLGASTEDVRHIVAKRERYVIRARIRGLWRRTAKAAGNVTGWSSFDAFFAEFATVEWQHNRALVPADPTRPIGPGNWIWQETLHSQFETDTRDGRLAYMRAHRQMFPMTYRDGQLRRDFGIDLITYNTMLESQGHVCAICKGPERVIRDGKLLPLAVDHCHKTGAVRGLLCKSCNNGIGHFADNFAVVRAAAEYLEHHAEKPTSVPASSPVPLEKER